MAALRLQERHSAAASVCEFRQSQFFFFLGKGVNMERCHAKNCKALLVLVDISLECFKEVSSTEVSCVTLGETTIKQQLGLSYKKWIVSRGITVQCPQGCITVLLMM